MKETLRVRSRKDRGGTADTNEDLKNITGRANSSLNSRQANPSMPPQPIIDKAQSPAESNKRSTISVRLQDKLAGHSVQSSLSVSDAAGQLKLKVKKKHVDNSQSRTGMKSPNNERSVELREKEREKQKKLMKE